MKLATQITLGFLIAISIDLLDSYVNYTLTKKVNTNTIFLAKSEAIIRNSSKLNKDALAMQSALRGYLLASDESTLVPYYNELKEFPTLIKEEDSLISFSSQHQKLDSILYYHNLWINYADSLIQSKKEAAISPANQNKYLVLFDAQFKRGVGKNYNDHIEYLFNSFDQNEYKVREERRKILIASVQRTELSSILFSISLIIIGVSIAVFLVRKISRRISSSVQLAESISRGNFVKVIDNKNDELTSLSVSLNSMSDILSRNITELTKKNDELNQFAYVVSHDLKAPIRGISNVVQWIEEDLSEEISPKMRQYLDIIPERIKRMENLIDGLLDYARISRDQSAKEKINVTLLVKQIAELIVPKGYTINAENLPELTTERILLDQVFSNLISNAARYTPADNGKIVVSCVEKENNYEFTVMDNGQGIDPEFHERIFVIFQTLRDKHDKESTGIGLAIVKKIIEDKGGTIRVISSSGNGASFIFTWPKN